MTIVPEPESESVDQQPEQADGESDGDAKTNLSVKSNPQTDGGSDVESEQDRSETRSVVIDLKDASDDDEAVQRIVDVLRDKAVEISRKHPDKEPPKVTVDGDDPQVEFGDKYTI